MKKEKELVYDEQSLMYRNPRGTKSGRNFIILGLFIELIAIMLVVVAIFMMKDNIPLMVVLIVVSAIYVGLGVWRIILGIRAIKRPYAIVIDKTNLILKQSDCYVYIPLAQIGKLTIECEGIKADLTSEGKEEINIKDTDLFYFENGVKKKVSSINMRKIAFILNSECMNTQSGVNWGKKFDETVQSLTQIVKENHELSAGGGFQKPKDKMKENLGESIEAEHKDND